MIDLPQQPAYLTFWINSFSATPSELSNAATPSALTSATMI